MAPDLELLDQELATTKIAHNRRVWESILDLQAENGIAKSQVLDRQHSDVLAELLLAKNTLELRAPSIGNGANPPKPDTESDEIRRTHLRNLSFKTVLRSDKKLNIFLKQARADLNNTKLDLGDRQIDSKGLLEVITTEPDAGIRTAAINHRKALDIKFAPLAKKIAERRNELAKGAGFDSFPAWVSCYNGLPPKLIATLCAELNRVLSQPIQNYLQVLQAASGNLEPEDIYYALENAPRGGHHAAPMKEQLRANAIKPSFQRFCKALGFDDRTRHIKVRLVDLPINGLTVLLAPPDEIFVVSAPFDSFRCWRVMFHEFGHALHALYNAQKGYAFSWEEAPCFQEAMAQLVNHLLLDERPLSVVFGHSCDGFRQDQQIIDLCRLHMWLSSAQGEVRLYEEGETTCNDQHAESSFDSIYTIFYPFHFQNMVLGDLIARTLKPHVPQQPAEWLIDRFYRAGSSKDWRAKVLKTLDSTQHGVSLDLLEKNLINTIRTLPNILTATQKAQR